MREIAKSSRQTTMHETPSEGISVVVETRHTDYTTNPVADLQRQNELAKNQRVVEEEIQEIRESFEAFEMRQVVEAQQVTKALQEVMLDDLRGGREQGPYTQMRQKLSKLYNFDYDSFSRQIHTALEQGQERREVEATAKAQLQILIDQIWQDRKPDLERWAVLLHESITQNREKIQHIRKKLEQFYGVEFQSKACRLNLAPHPQESTNLAIPSEQQPGELTLYVPSIDTINPAERQKAAQDLIIDSFHELSHQQLQSELFTRLVEAAKKLPEYRQALDLYCNGQEPYYDFTKEAITNYIDVYIRQAQFNREQQKDTEHVHNVYALGSWINTDLADEYFQQGKQIDIEFVKRLFKLMQDRKDETKNESTSSKTLIGRLVGIFSGLFRSRQRIERQEENKLEHGDMRSREDMVIEDELMHAKVKLKQKVGTVPGGAFYAKLSGDGSAIFKPDIARNDGKGGLTYRVNGVLKTTFDNTGYTRRERAAYLIDRFLGLNMVPTTIIRKVGENAGSLQRWIDGVQGEGYDPKTITGEEIEVTKLKILDFILRHHDRGGGFEHPLRNTVVKDGKIYAIDNSWILRKGSAKEQLPKEMSNIIVPPEIIDGFKNLLARPESVQLLRKILGELIEEEVIDRLFVRIKAFEHAITEDGKLDTKRFEEAVAAS